MILLSLILACGDKNTDTADLIDTDTTPEEDDTSTNESDTNDDTDDTSDTNDTQDTDNTGDGEENGDGSTPVSGAWTVQGPEFTTNTCGGGESFPDTRDMTLSIDGNTVSLLIEEPGEYTYNFNCTLTDSEFECEDIVIENSIPVLPCTLTYTHQLQGMFTDNKTLEGDYTINTTSSGGSGCSESNLGFTTPCEQSGTMTANSN